MNLKSSLMFDVQIQNLWLLKNGRFLRVQYMIDGMHACHLAPLRHRKEVAL